jgi:hypothetical protein
MHDQFDRTIAIVLITITIIQEAAAAAKSTYKRDRHIQSV